MLPALVTLPSLADLAYPLYRVQHNSMFCTPLPPPEKLPGNFRARKTGHGTRPIVSYQKRSTAPKWSCRCTWHGTCGARHRA
eukprot:356177-Chlamydomonas_euryale.AAC.4